MGKVIALSFASRPVGNPAYGTVHCSAGDDGRFEICHESSSGNSWGSFETFATPQEAIAGARRLSRENYSGCEVAISSVVLEACGSGPDLPARDRGEF